MTTKQKPVGSPFGAASTAEDVIAGIDLTGKTAIVTGGYSGIGLEAVGVLLAAGAKVFVPARDIEKAKRNLVESPGAIIESLDLMDPQSIDAFAERFLAGNQSLDILINNAGIMASPFARDARGNESQLSTNVLGHYRLTCRLWTALKDSSGARVVLLSSANHRVKVSDFLRDPNFERTAYEPWKAYANSKAGNILLAVAFDEIGNSHGIRAYAVHPGGIIETGLARHMDMNIARAVGMIDEEGNAIIDPESGWKTPQQGAATMIWAATSPLLTETGGVYCADCDVGTMLSEDEGELSLTGVSPGLLDRANALHFKQVCELLTGVCLD